MTGGGASGMGALGAERPNAVGEQAAKTPSEQAITATPRDLCNVPTISAPQAGSPASPRPKIATKSVPRPRFMTATPARHKPRSRRDHDCVNECGNMAVVG